MRSEPGRIIISVDYGFRESSGTRRRPLFRDQDIDLSDAENEFSDQETTSEVDIQIQLVGRFNYKYKQVSEHSLSIIHKK